jgi:putative ABC transport system permease protein
MTLKWRGFDPPPVGKEWWRSVFAVTIADLRFRARQFLIATFGVGLVLALALLLTGLAAGFRAEVEGTVNGVGATTWVLSGAAQGRITAFEAFPELEALVVSHEPGVRSAAPLLLVPVQAAHYEGRIVTMNLAGVIPGRLGDPAVVSGHGLRGPSQMVLDDRLRVPVGATLSLGGHTFHVVGTVTNRSMAGGIGIAYVPLASAQAVAVGGQPLISAVVTTGRPAKVPAGLAAHTPDQIVTDTVSQLAGAVSSIDSTRWLMWTVAVVIVASLLYVAALERTRDFAVLKALGSSTRALFFSLMLEALVVTLLATVFAESIVNLLAPTFSQPVDMDFNAYASLPIAAVLVGVVASLGALRRVTSADPVGAFS